MATTGWLRRLREALRVAQAGAKLHQPLADGSAEAPNPGTSFEEARSETQEAQHDPPGRGGCSRTPGWTPQGSSGRDADGYGRRSRPNADQGTPAWRAKEVSIGTN